MRNFILVVLAVIVICAELLQAQEGNQVANRVLQDWQKRRTDATVTRWELDVTVTRYKRVSTETGVVQVPNDVTYAQHFSLALDPVNGWYRLDATGQDWSQVEKAVQPYRGATVYYDGECRSCRYPVTGETATAPNRGYLADFDMRKSKLRDNPISSLFWPVLFDWGIVIVQPSHVLHVGQYHKYQAWDYPDILLPTQRKGEADTVWIQGAPESGRYVDNLLEFKIASKSASAILSLVRNVRTRSTGAITREMEIECKYAGTGLDSHPQSWTIRQYDGQKKLVEYAVSVRKREADATLPQGFYDLQPKAGMVVAKLRNQDEGEPEKRTSTVDLFKTTEDGDLVAIGTMNDAPRPLSWVRPLIAVTLMVLAGLAYPWRSRKPKSPSTNPGV